MTGAVDVSCFSFLSCVIMFVSFRSFNVLFWVKKMLIWSWNFFVVSVVSCSGSQCCAEQNCFPRVGKYPKILRRADPSCKTWSCGKMGDDWSSGGDRVPPKTFIYKRIKRSYFCKYYFVAFILLNVFYSDCCNIVFSPCSLFFLNLVVIFQVENACILLLLLMSDQQLYFSFLAMKK